MTDPWRDPADPGADPLVAALRDRLEAQAEAIDPVTRARLAAARHRALAQLRPQRGPGWAGRLALAATAPAALLLGVALYRAPGTGVPAVPPPAAVLSREARTAAPSIEALEVLAGGVPVEVLEDLEFYEWLAAGGDDAS